MAMLRYVMSHLDLKWNERRVAWEPFKKSSTVELQVAKGPPIEMVQLRDKLAWALQTKRCS